MKAIILNMIITLHAASDKVGLSEVVDECVVVFCAFPVLSSA